MNKRWIALLLTGALTLGLCGCRDQMAETGEPSPGRELNPTTAPEKTRIEVYQETLERLLEERIGPDGQHWGDAELTDQDISENEFAVADADMDGELELIVRWTTTCVAGYRTMVYGYDEAREELVEKLWGTESCRFYNNRMAQVDSSHNQGPGGRFWPYTVMAYNAETGKYDDIASLDAWDFKLVPNPEYQKSVGVEGDEFIYYYSVYEDASDGSAYQDTIMTQTEYDTWYQETFGGAEEIKVDYQPLTEENIGKLGD